MSDQANEANKFAREQFGSEVDAAAGAAGFKVLGPEDAGGPPQKPWVELPGGGSRVIADFARDLGLVLAETALFMRESIIVTVNPKTGEIDPMSAKSFITWVTKHVVVYEERAVKVGKEMTTIKTQRDMPKTTSECVLESEQFREHIRPLLRVHQVRMLVKRADGRIELLPEGYDAESEIFTIKSGIEIDEKMDLDRARGVFKAMYGEFPIEDDRSYSVALTLPLSLFGMGLQATEAPRLGSCIIANTRRAGKSLIAQIGISAVFGWPKNTPKMSSEEEFNKTLAAVVLQGRPYMFLDNLKGHFESSLLEGFLTTPEVSVRVMGTHRFMTGKVCCILVVTGNNLTLSDDLQWRVLQCNLYEPEFSPLAKKHTRDLNPVVVNRKEERGQMLSALYALVRHWDKSGRPPAGTRESPYQIPGFAEWSDIFGGIMQCAGFANPLVPPPSEKRAAHMTEHQHALVELLAYDVSEKQKVKAFAFEELIRCCIENELLTWKFKWKVKTDDGGGERYEIGSDAASAMGKLFTNEMASEEEGRQRLYTMKDGRRIGVSTEGKGRGKRYLLSFVGRVTSPA